MKTLFTIAFVSILSFGMAQKDDAAKAEAKKLINSGMQKIAADDCPGALLDFEAAMKKDSSNMDAYLKHAFCLAQSGNYEGAIKDYSTVIRLKPDHGFAYVSRGAAKNKLQKYQEAMSDFNKAIEINPKDAQAYFNRGEAKKGLGNSDGACEDWNTSKKYGNDEAKIVLKNNRCK